MKKLIFMPLVLLGFSPTVFAEAGPTQTSTLLLDSEVTVSAPRVKLGKKTMQQVELGGDASAPISRPSLDAALEREANVQVIPTPLRNATLSLNGMDGEHVAVARDGDPLLGRIEGAFDARTLQLGSAERVSVYRGLDSLPYGSQNIAGAIVLESPWEVESRKEARIAAGSLGRSLVQVKASQRASRERVHAWASTSSWRSNAIVNAEDPQNTLSNSVARLGGDLGAVRKDLLVVGGRGVEGRVTGFGSAQNAKGLMSGEATKQDQFRYGLAADLRSEQSKFRISWNRYQSEFQGLATDNTPNREDREVEQSIRLGPQLEETIDGTTVSAGMQGEWRFVESSRIPGREVRETAWGPYFGARRAISEHFIAGAGLRYDSVPNAWSPRGEWTHVFESALGAHETVLSSGLGFREVTAKEKYLRFENASVGYRVVGNPDLSTERAWMSELKHVLRSSLDECGAGVFLVRTRDAIAYVPALAAGPGIWTYANVGSTRTLGAQLHWERRYAFELKSRVQYQFLDGKNLSTGGGLFLQPEHRVALQFGRQAKKGFSVFGAGVWTARQAFVDADRDGQADDDSIPAFWAVAAEASYAFRFSPVAETFRVFTRVDNALNRVNARTFPIEPRTFLAGVSAEL